MSPFWKNVNEELQYQGMSLSTLSKLTNIPYTTITNGKNRPDSIPSADVALKIANVLNKSLEQLLGEDVAFISNSDFFNDKNKISKQLFLFNKYSQLIFDLEKCSSEVQKSFFRMAKSILEQTDLHKSSIKNNSTN